MHLISYLEFLRGTEETLARCYRLVSDRHAADADVHFSTARFAAQCQAHATALAETLQRYGPPAEPPPENMPATPVPAGRDGPAGLLRDLLDAYQMAGLAEITWSLIRQAAQGARDTALLDTVDTCAPEVTAQLAWLAMTLKAAAPQTLLVAP